MDWKVCISLIVFRLCIIHGNVNAEPLTTNVRIVLLLQYSSTEIIRFGLTFNNVPNDEHNVYLVMVTGMWSADLSFEEISKDKLYYKQMRARSLKLYAMLTSRQKLCDSQLMFETEHLQPSDSTNLKVDFVNNCDGVVGNKPVVITKGQFSCRTPPKVKLPPYLYYVWAHEYLNATVNIGPYDWRSSEHRSSFSIVAEHFDNNSMLRCKIALSNTGDHEIVLNEYKLITRHVTPHHKDKPLSFVIRYGNNHHVKFDCIDARPHGSFGWHLIEVNVQNYVRVSDVIINNRTFTKADNNTQLICLFYVRDERVITKKAVLIYDPNIKYWVNREKNLHLYYMIGTAAFVIIIVLALLILLWYYKTSHKSDRVDQNEMTENRRLLPRNQSNRDTLMLPMNQPKVLKNKPAIKPKPPVNLVRPLVTYTNEHTEAHSSKDDKYATQVNNIEDETPVYENLRTDFNLPRIGYGNWKK